MTMVLWFTTIRSSTSCVQDNWCFNRAHIFQPSERALGFLKLSRVSHSTPFLPLLPLRPSSVTVSPSPPLLSVHFAPLPCNCCACAAHGRCLRHLLIHEAVTRGGGGEGKRAGG